MNEFLRLRDAAVLIGLRQAELIRRWEARDWPVYQPVGPRSRLVRAVEVERYIAEHLQTRPVDPDELRDAAIEHAVRLREARRARGRVGRTG